MTTPTCTIPTCNKIVFARGFCKAHLNWLYCNKAPLDDKETCIKLRQEYDAIPKPSTCMIAECNRKIVGRGMCNKHYSTWVRRGKPDPQHFINNYKEYVLQPWRGHTRCSYPGCTRPHERCGFCSKHYSKLLRYNAKSFIQDTQRCISLLRKLEEAPKKTCKLPGCLRPIKEEGFCNLHYKLALKTNPAIFQLDQQEQISTLLKLLPSHKMCEECKSRVKHTSKLCDKCYRESKKL